MSTRRSKRNCVVNSRNRAISSAATTANARSNYRKYQIKCRSTRLGNYRFFPTEPLLLNSTGVQFSAPHMLDGSPTSFLFKWTDIEYTMLHTGDTEGELSVIFLDVSAQASRRAMDKFNITDPNVGFRFDSSSEDLTHKRIILFPEDAKRDWTPAFKHFLVNKVMQLDLTAANELLVLSSPNIFAPMFKMDTDTESDSSQETAASPPDPRGGCAPRVVEQELLFPTPSHDLLKESERETVVCGFPHTAMCPSPVSVSLRSYCFLQDGTFLNDEIIEFFLRWLQETKMSEADRRRSHFFSTKFYTRLTQKSAYDDEKAPSKERRYSRVKKWIKNVDIFEKDFLFIPINRDSHWFLAVICYPGLLESQDNNDEPISVPVSKEPKRKRPRTRAFFSDNDSRDSRNVIEDLLMLDEADATGQDMIDKDYGSASLERGYGGKTKRLDEDMSEAGSIADIDQMEQSASDQEDLRAPALDEGDIKQRPCILIFDSLRNPHLRSRVVVTLREFLECEWKEKKDPRGESKKFNLKGHCPKVPQQPNSSDCGVFMLQYAENFIKDPFEGFRLPITNLAEWFSVKEMRLKRGQIAQLIREMSAAQNPGVELNFPTLTFDAGWGYIKKSSEETAESTMEEGSA